VYEFVRLERSIEEMGGAQSRKEATPAGSPSSTAISPEDTLFIPKGLYQRCSWEPKTLRRLILAKKLSAFYPGKEENDGSEHLEECPICFLFYPGGLNRSVCCKKGVCTECFLQIKKPNIQATCPFCNTTPYGVLFNGPLSKEEKQKEEQEQQKVLELKIKMRQEEEEEDRVRAEKRRLSISVNSTTSTSPSQQESSDKFPGPQSLPTHIVNIRNNTSIDSPIPHREYSTSYPPSNTTNSNNNTSTNSSTSSSQTLKTPHKDSTSNKDEVDLEELMLMEAIRLSLMSSPQPSDKTTPTQVHDAPILTSTSPRSKSPRSGHQSYNSMESQNENTENEIANEQEYENNSESSEDFELALALSMSLQGERR